MKRGLVFLILAIIIAGGVFAQETTSGAVNNWVSGEASFLGAGVRYERMLNANWSIGANIYWNTMIVFWDEFGIDACARYYLWGKVFFVGAGLGFHIHTNTNSDSNNQVAGVALTPEAGWKIDFGDAGGFFMQPGIKLPFTVGKKSGSDNKIGVGFGFVPYVCVGYAF